VFLGQFHGRIDAQGRFPVPPALYACLAPGLVVTRGLDRCLLLFPRQMWQELVSKMSVLPLTLRQARSLRRLFFAGALDCSADSDGCIALPEELRSYAQIKGELVLVGVGDYLELWSPVCWSEALARLEAEAGLLAEALAI
jgi:MraZ protein